MTLDRTAPRETPATPGATGVLCALLFSTVLGVAAPQASPPDEFRLEHWECILSGCTVGVGTLRRDGEVTYELRSWPDTLRWPDSLRQSSDTISGFRGTLNPGAFQLVLSFRPTWIPQQNPIRRAADGYGAIVSVRFGEEWRDLDSSSIEPALIATLDSLFRHARWSVQNHRLDGKWTLELRVHRRQGTCSPPSLEGATAAAVAAISDSARLAGPWAFPEQLGVTTLGWTWLARGPTFRRGELLIRWQGDSSVHFEFDHSRTHDGGLYADGRWFGDSIVGEWEQAGYCPTPSGLFALRRR